MDINVDEVLIDNDFNEIKRMSHVMNYLMFLHPMTDEKTGAPLEKMEHYFTGDKGTEFTRLVYNGFLTEV